MSLNSKRGTKSPDFSTVESASRHPMCANEAARTRAGRCVRIAMRDSANQVVVRDRAAQHEEHEQQRADRV